MIRSIKEKNPQLKGAVLVLSFFLFPSFAFAFAANFQDFACSILSVLQALTPILFGIALIVFFWGVANFIRGADNTATHAKGRSYMIWGILALFALTSYAGILRFMEAQFGFSTTGSFIQILPAGGNSQTCGSIPSVTTSITYP